MPQSEQTVETSSYMLPSTEYIEFVLPNPGEGAASLRLELWEAEQIIETAHAAAGGDPVAWVRNVRAAFEKQYEISFSLFQTDTIIRRVRDAWDAYAKKNSLTQDSPSGTTSTLPESVPNGEQSS